MRYRSFHTSLRKGLKEHGADAYKAIVSELRQLLSEKKALKPVHRGDLSARQLKQSIRSLMFLKTKFDGLGRFEKIKARLVANGKQQDTYPDTCSPMVVLMCLTIAAKEGRDICAVDIGGAYLNAERVCEEGDEIVMELEPMLVAILAKHEPQIKPFVDEKGRMLVTLIYMVHWMQRRFGTRSSQGCCETWDLCLMRWTHVYSTRPSMANSARFCCMLMIC
jgi:hypothetical protein